MSVVAARRRYREPGSVNDLIAGTRLPSYVRRTNNGVLWRAVCSL